MDIFGIELPKDKDTTFPLKMAKETFDGPASLVAKRATVVLCRGGLAVGPMWRDHRNAFFWQFLIRLMATDRHRLSNRLAHPEYLLEDIPEPARVAYRWGDHSV